MQTTQPAPTEPAPAPPGQPPLMEPVSALPPELTPATAVEPVSVLPPELTPAGPVQAIPAEPAPTTPIQPAAQAPVPTTPVQAVQPAPVQYGQTVPMQPQDLQGTAYPAQMTRREERHAHNQAAGIPAWGVVLIIVGLIALLGNFGMGDFGWVFGLALGAWLAYLGLRPVQQGQSVNWWLTGLGLLIGLGSIAGATGVTLANESVFPMVLVLVGLGILAEHFLFRSPRNQ